MPTQSKLFQKYDALLRGDRPWQKGEINGLKKQLGGWARSSLTEAAIADLRERSNYCRPLSSDINLRWMWLTRDRCYAIAQEPREAGIVWLLKKGFRKNDEPCEDKRVGKKLTDFARNVIRGFQRFGFAGFYCRDYQHGRYYLEPVYRCHGTGGFFDYYYDRDLPDHSAFQILKEKQLSPELAPCSGCINLHGAIYGDTMMVCGFHPSGWKSGACPDYAIA